MLLCFVWVKKTKFWVTKSKKILAAAVWVDDSSRRQSVAPDGCASRFFAFIFSSITWFLVIYVVCCTRWCSDCSSMGCFSLFALAADNCQILFKKNWQKRKKLKKIVSLHFGWWNTWFIYGSYYWYLRALSWDVMIHLFMTAAWWVQTASFMTNLN